MKQSGFIRHNTKQTFSLNHVLNSTSSAIVTVVMLTTFKLPGLLSELVQTK